MKSAAQAPAERDQRCRVHPRSGRRGAVGKLLLGSTTQRILLDVPVPILLVEATDAD